MQRRHASAEKMSGWTGWHIFINENTVSQNLLFNLFFSFLFEIQKEKLQSELLLVKGNLKVMSDMLNELIPGQSQLDDTMLLQVRVVYKMYCLFKYHLSYI